MTGAAGSEMSKMWMPSNPLPTSLPPQVELAFAAASHERIRMFS